MNIVLNDQEIKKFISKDYARNYFIALGLERGLETFKHIYQFDGHILFHRASGNLQFAYENGDVSEVRDLIKSLEFDTLIGAKSTCNQLGLKVKKEGAFIAVLKKEDYLHIESTAVKISLKDLESIEHLYSKVFTGYPKTKYMTEKLMSGRGIGYMLKKGDVISVAQSDFHQLIVGVATDPDYLRMGHAKNCMHALIQAMFETVDKVFLQYDNLEAGKLYQQLGFKIIDQVMHYER